MVKPTRSSVASIQSKKVYFYFLFLSTTLINLPNLENKHRHQCKVENVHQEFRANLEQF